MSQSQFLQTLKGAYFTKNTLQQELADSEAARRNLAEELNLARRESADLKQRLHSTAQKLSQGECV